jgi:hypothetical protein
MGKRSSRQNNIKLLEKDIVKITKSAEDSIYEIGDSITTDLAEAVAMMMRVCDDSDFVWKRGFGKSNLEKIDPRKALYWLSGGDLEWITLHNYCKSWQQCEDDYEAEFGFSILSIIKKSNCLEDIKSGFITYLNLPTLYEFALEKNFLK